ncbi:MAG TPA: TonB family protein, partial [Longimicrobium sp.]|nr:TonB family protein [Longimicrobium sp.]
ATLTLWYEADGQNVRRDLLRHSLPQEMGDTLQELVFAALERGPQMERAWGARLHIGMGGEVAYTTSPREYCPPRPRNRMIQAEMEAYQGTGTGARNRGRAVERTVLVEVTVHPAGYVESAKVLRGATAGGTLDNRLRDFLRQHSFVPASLDGVPVQGSLAVPIRLRG